MRARTWIKRIVLGLVALIVVAVGAVLILVHTGYGRGVIADQIDAKLAEVLIGGGSVGRIDGSPFGKVTLHDVVLNGPDGEPAVTVKRVTLELGLLPLISKQANLGSVDVEGVEVVLKRERDGTYEAEHMLRPAPSTGWSVDISKLTVRGVHVAAETADGWMNLDGGEIYGTLHAPFGGTLLATVAVRGAWRERAAGVTIAGAVSVSHGVIRAPSLIATVGGATVAAANLRVAAAAKELEGTVVVNAPAVAVAQLAPGVRVPADVALAVTLAPAGPWTRVSLLGAFGPSQVRGMVDADLAARRARGVIATGEVDMGLVTAGRVVGTGGAVVMFDASQGAAGKLPTARGVAQLWGNVADFPAAQAAVAFDTAGDRARTVVGVAGPALRALVEGEVARAGDVLRLERGTVIASTSDPKVASGGAAPVRGALNARLQASGVLAPEPRLAVTGRVDGRRLRVADLSVATLSLAIDARDLPRKPLGRAELALDDLVRGDMQLGQLKVTAANRPDGKIQVSARSRPKRDPWRIDVDALVTPPGHGKTTLVDIQRHEIRAGDGGTWRGTSGHLEIGPRRVVLRGLHSASATGALDVAGELERPSGDLSATVAATGLAAALVDPSYRGSLDAHAAVKRTRGELSGTLAVTGRGLVVRAGVKPIDLDAKVAAAPGKVTADVTATGADLGSAKVALAVDAPHDLADAAAWKHLDRSALRTGTVTLQGLDLVKLFALLGKPDALYQGRVDGTLNLAAMAGGLRFHIVQPDQRGGDGIHAELTLAENDRGEVMPSVMGTVDGFGRFEVAARIAVPDHPFDPVAWKALGADALRGATVRAHAVQWNPWVFASSGIITELHGRASLDAQIGQGARTAQVTVDVAGLRGTPIVTPVDARLTASLDDKGAAATLAVRSGMIALLDARARLPVTMDQVRANPRALLAAPLDATATVPETQAGTLLRVFGRYDVVGGTLTGNVKIAGTLGHPTATARITGANLQASRGTAARPATRLTKLTIDGAWDGKIAKVMIDGVEPKGSLQATAQTDPKDLAHGTLALRAKAFDLAPLTVFAPGPAGGAAGRLDADLHVTGLVPATARIVGEMHLAGARLPIAPSVGTMHRTKLDVVIREGQMKVDAVGRLGGGDVKLASTFKLDGTMPASGDVTLTLRKVSPIGAVEPEIDANVTAKLSRKGDQWLADVFVKDGKVVVPSGHGERLDPVGAPTDMILQSGKRVTRRPLVKAPPQHASLIAKVTLYATQVESDELRGIVKGRLTISADGDAVGIVGDIEADRGDIALFGHRYQVEQAAVRFDGSTDPVLDVRISHDFPEVTTTTTVRGRLSKPELELSSNPGVYSQGQLLGFLLGGEPGGDPSRASMADQATGVGASVIADKLRGYMKSALPIDIDVLSYEAASATSSAAVLVGSWLTSSLFLAYRQHLDARPDENRAEGEIEWWVSRRVSIEGTAGDRGYSGVDALWRKRY